MKTLYLFTQTPNENNIKLVKNLIDNNDCIVFIQNGVYIAKHKAELDCQKYILKADLEARGIETHVEIEIVDYNRLVDLFFEYVRTVTI